MAPDNTWLRGDMKFIFECSTLDIDLNTSREISYLQATMYYFVYKPANSEVYEGFPKIFKLLSGGHTNFSEHFPNFSEHFRRLPRKIRRFFDLRSINFGSFSSEIRQNRHQR